MVYQPITNKEKEIFSDVLYLGVAGPHAHGFLDKLIMDNAMSLQNVLISGMIFLFILRSDTVDNCPLMLKCIDVSHNNKKDYRNSVTNYMIPFLMVTAGAEKINIMEASKAKVSQYIIKPFTHEMLKEKIDVAIKTQEEIKSVQIYPQC